ncbi:MAG: NAD(P)/FAD-dependent oxidoreductase [Anaerolineae bacterium]
MRFVIVGGGVAGITASMDLARRNLGEVIVFSDEAHPYYYRPQLTEFLAGNLTLNELLRRPLSWYEQRGIQLRLSSPVTAIDPKRKVVTVNGESEVAYDKLLLAVGSTPFVPPIKGADKEGVRTWRTLDDTLELERVAASCQQVVVIGGGLLGLEAARGLKSFCRDITVLEYFPRLLPRQLDVQGARLLQDFVESLGINVVVGAKTEAFEGDKHVTGVRLAEGQIYAAQTVVVAAGVRCNTKLASDAGLRVDRGVIVDDCMRTSDGDIFAAGDVAVYRGHSWAIAPIAQAQGRVAAANIAGVETIYDVVVPSTTLKVVGIDVSSVGDVNPDSDGAVEIRQLDEAAGTYKKIVLRDGVIVGSIVINDKLLAKELENKIAAGATVTADQARSLIA